VTYLAIRRFAYVLFLFVFVRCFHVCPCFLILVLSYSLPRAMDTMCDARQCHPIHSCLPTLVDTARDTGLSRYMARAPRGMRTSLLQLHAAQDMTWFVQKNTIPLSNRFVFFLSLPFPCLCLVEKKRKREKQTAENTIAIEFFSSTPFLLPFFLLRRPCSRVRPMHLQVPPNEECQFCLESEGKLIKPCLCRLAHRKCLDDWRIHHKNDATFASCEICRFRYDMVPYTDTPWQTRRSKLLLWMCIVWDAIEILAMIEGGLCLAAFVLRLLDSIFSMCIVACGGGGSGGVDVTESRGDGKWAILVILSAVIVFLCCVEMISTTCEWLSTRWQERVTTSRRWIDIYGQQVCDQRHEHDRV
jgi:hypothetical protein